MTRAEAIQILAVLKAAYPNSYKGMTKTEANGTVNVWATQFIDMPVSVVMIAINKLISTNTFPPSIGEVKEKIRSLYFEAWQLLDEHKKATEGIKFSSDPNEEPLYVGKKLSPQALQTVQEILKVCEPLRTKQLIEPTISDLITGYEKYLSGGGCDSTKLLKED